MDPTKTPETWTEVVRLYTLGQISSGRAAELAGISRVEFLLALAAGKVFPLGHELRDLEAATAEMVRRLALDLERVRRGQEV